jgi:HD-GYP domain-containing protein (c-di-GMP phosphodiesterase class II)/DNA-binding CsgD family transcriptional regulator
MDHFLPNPLRVDAFHALLQSIRSNALFPSFTPSPPTEHGLMSTHRLAELLGALSLATDGANGVPPETALRTCIVATAIGRVSGLDEVVLHDVYMAALLRFLGCTAYAHETAHRYGAGDDQAMLRALLTADTARPIDIVRHAARGLGAEIPFAQRAAALVRLSTDSHPADALALAHCGLATTLAAQLEVGEGVVRALGQVYERYDGRGSPSRLAGDAIDPVARLVMVAFRVVTHHTLEGREAAVEVVKARRGSELDPGFADAFLESAGDVLEAIDRDSVWDSFLDAEPQPVVQVPVGDLARIAGAFADYVDIKSPYTLGHSRGVAALASRIATTMGLDAQEVGQLHIAALLHDLGRVAIPNGIWDKPGRFNAIERERAESHAWYTMRILMRSPLFSSIAPLAGHAHERADGSGYPRAVPLAMSPVPGRILSACDVFHALGEERPHRPAHDRRSSATVLADEVRAGRLDVGIVDAILSRDGASAPRPRTLPDQLTEREVEILCLVARGLSNKEIASRLAISAKTVQHHVAHVYEKTGVRSRAAAAIYAVAKRLLEE